MYSRAPRNVGQLAGRTPQHVGPGTYDVIGPDGKKQQLDSYAPFLSLSLREDIFIDRNDNPGPGQYDLISEPTFAKGGTSLANREARFLDRREEIPGPGAYTVENKENRHGTTEIKVSKQRVKFNRKKNPPSIQDPKTAYGFEESANGELIPQPPPERDPTLGPAYYNTSLVPSNLSQYKGIHFGKYSSKRIEFGSAKAGPGPGEYDVIEPIHIDVEHYHMKNMVDKKPELKVPRYPENLVKTIEKENVPGPGKYEQKRLFDDVASKQSDIFGLEADRPPFGVQSKRFDMNKTFTPGPGAYNDARTAFNTIVKASGLKKIPFLQSSVRFDSENVYKTRSAPGPGQYRINGFAEENLRKAIIDSRRKPAFGQSAIRKFNLAKKDDVATPGPAQYQIKDKVFKPIKENPTASFASGVKQRELQFEDTPGPTAYDVPKAFEHLIHTRREAPRNKQALKRQQTFNVVSKRDFNLASSDSDLPGPASYNQNLPKGKLSIAKLTDKRWKDNKDKQPGPGEYDLSPMLMDTLLKGTFNATLNNPFVNRERQKAVSETVVTNKLGVNGLNQTPEAIKVS